VLYLPRFTMRRAISTLALAIAALSLAAAAPAQTRPPQPKSSAELRLALDRLAVLGSALYIAAHPDDENTAMLAWLANGKLVRAGYLSLTRGDGGQNLIGSEQGPALGVLRTQELLEARRIDGAEQFFTRAIDFGYSKTADETFRFWDREVLLGDVVRVIRTFRPDVIVTRFPTTGEGGHGQHTASAILALEAFHAAGDASRFPRQLTGLEPWQPRRIFWNAFRWGGEVEGSDVKVDLGAYDDLLGRSYTELAGASRTKHKSQGFGTAERRGRYMNDLMLLGGEPAEGDPFSGIDLSWRRVPGSEKVASLVEEVRRRFDPSDRAAVVPLLMSLRREIAALPSGYWRDRKLAEVEQIIVDASGLWLEAIAERPEVTQGGNVKVTATAINRSRQPLRLERVTVGRAAAERPARQLESNIPFGVPVALEIPRDAKITNPYWLDLPQDEGMYAMPDEGLTGLAETPPQLTATFTIALAEESFDVTVPILFRWTDRVEGELHRPLTVVPPVTFAFPEPLYVFPSAAERSVSVVARAAKEVDGEVRLSAPAGWSVTPASRRLRAAAGSETRLSFTVRPPAGTSSGDLALSYAANGETAGARIETVEYAHIPPQIFFLPAAARAVRVETARPAATIGYIAGSGDEIPSILRQLGYTVEMLTDAQIAGGDLSRYAAIITGIRAFNAREELKRNAARLFDYVNVGGRLVVQYNTNDSTLGRAFSPLPLEISRDRITDETAPVAIVSPGHPLLSHPNAITLRDFDGWVQERGLYFPGKWDPRFETVIASADPGEEPKPGGLLYARHGKGVYIYTGYAFFRQLPAGVPGAMRLFVNLVSGAAE
jgi:LmbE family N-acetylglucosaminyl deacetylase